MRNLLQYPITDEEVIGYLKQLADEALKEEAIGDMRPLFLDYAIEAIRDQTRLKKALEDAGHYVALCPPPPEASGNLRIELLEERERIAKAVTFRPG